MSSAKISTASSESSQSSMKPGKGTKDYLHYVLEPRGIKIIADSFDLDGVDSLVLPSDSELEQGLGAAYVTCDPDAFAKGAQLAYHQYSETQWTAEVYQAYFLRTNLPPTNYGVKRLTRHAYTWSGDNRILLFLLLRIWTDASPTCLCINRLRYGMPQRTPGPIRIGLTTPISSSQHRSMIRMLSAICRLSQHFAADSVAMIASYQHLPTF